MTPRELFLCPHTQLYIYTSRVCVCPIHFYIYALAIIHYIGLFVYLFYKSAAALIFEGIRMVAKPQAKPVVATRERLFYFHSLVYSPSNELKIKSLFSGVVLERQQPRTMRVLAFAPLLARRPRKVFITKQAEAANSRAIHKSAHYLSCV